MLKDMKLMKINEHHEVDEKWESIRSTWQGGGGDLR